MAWPPLLGEVVGCGGGGEAGSVACRSLSFWSLQALSLLAAAMRSRCTVSSLMSCASSRMIVLHAHQSPRRPHKAFRPSKVRPSSLSC